MTGQACPSLGYCVDWTGFPMSNFTKLARINYRYRAALSPHAHNGGSRVFRTSSFAADDRWSRVQRSGVEMHAKQRHRPGLKIAVMGIKPDARAGS